MEFSQPYATHSIMQFTFLTGLMQQKGTQGDFAGPAGLAAQECPAACLMPEVQGDRARVGLGAHGRGTHCRVLYVSRYRKNAWGGRWWRGGSTNSWS